MKSKGIAYLLWFFLGLIGIHKFYLGKIGMGILYLFTLGFAGIGWVIDLFTLGEQVENYNMNKQLKLTSRNLTAMAQTMTAATTAVGTSVAGMATASMANSVNQQAAAQLQSSASSINNDKVKQLTDLKSLLDSGVISQAEFDAEKAKILNS